MCSVFLTFVNGQQQIHRCEVRRDRGITTLQYVGEHQYWYYLVYVWVTLHPVHPIFLLISHPMRTVHRCILFMVVLRGLSIARSNPIIATVISLCPPDSSRQLIYPTSLNCQAAYFFLISHLQALICTHRLTSPLFSLMHSSYTNISRFMSEVWMEKGGEFKQMVISWL